MVKGKATLKRKSNAQPVVGGLKIVSEYYAGRRVHIVPIVSVDDCSVRGISLRNVRVVEFAAECRSGKSCTVGVI